MFRVTASLLNFDTKSPMTDHLLLAAQCIVSFIFPLACFALEVSVGLGKAVAKRVDVESMMMRPVLSGGKFGFGWRSRASRCGRVGVAK